jgi:hypothetical protein
MKRVLIAVALTQTALPVAPVVEEALVDGRAVDRHASGGAFVLQRLRRVIRISRFARGTRNLNRTAACGENDDVA